jgi:hypothetical protein
MNLSARRAISIILNCFMCGDISTSKNYSIFKEILSDRNSERAAGLSTVNPYLLACGIDGLGFLLFIDSI